MPTITVTALKFRGQKYRSRQGRLETKSKGFGLTYGHLTSDQTRHPKEPFKVIYKKQIQKGNVGNVQILEEVKIVRRNEESINDPAVMSSSLTRAASTTEEIIFRKIKLQIFSDQFVQSIRAENAVIIHSIKESVIPVRKAAARNVSTSTEFLQSQLENELSLLPVNTLMCLSFIYYVHHCTPSDPVSITKLSTHLSSTNGDSVMSTVKETLVVNGRIRGESKREIRAVVHSSTDTDLFALKSSNETNHFQERSQLSVQIPTSQKLPVPTDFSFTEKSKNSDILAKFPVQDIYPRSMCKSVTTLKLDEEKQLCLKRKAENKFASDRKMYVRRDISVDESFTLNHTRGIRSKRSKLQKHTKVSEKTKYSYRDKILKTFELHYLKSANDISLCKRAKHDFNDKELDEVSKHVNADDKISSFQDEVPGRSKRITQMPQTFTKLLQEIGLHSDFNNEDPKHNISYMHSLIFDEDFSELDDVENCALNFDELANFLSNDSVMSHFFRRYMEDIDSTGLYSIDSMRRARYFLGLKQIDSDEVRMYIVQLQGKLKDMQTDNQELKPKIRLITVTAEVFENAMRQCQIYEYELTFSNYFPRNCRMFIAIPVYKGGFINRRDNKDRSTHTNPNTIALAKHLKSIQERSKQMKRHRQYFSAAAGILSKVAEINSAASELRGLVLARGQLLHATDSSTLNNLYSMQMMAVVDCRQSPQHKYIDQY